MTGRCTGGQHHAPTAGGACPCGAVTRHPVAVPVRAGDAEIVAALAEALFAKTNPSDDWNADMTEPVAGHVRDHYRGLAAALLPVVRRIAEQRAAEELLAAADDPVSSLVARTAEFGLPSRVIAVGTLYARAAALTATATPNHGTDTTT